MTLVAVKAVLLVIVVLHVSSFTLQQETFENGEFISVGDESPTLRMFTPICIILTPYKMFFLQHKCTDKTCIDDLATKKSDRGEYFQSV